MEGPLRLHERISHEIQAAQRLLADAGPCVSLWGGARSTPASPEYQAARECARRLVQDGWTVITGGGPGVMEAANLGAREAQGSSIGLSIKLPFEEAVNAHLTRNVSFQHFASRKVAFLRHSHAFVVFPGGYGTLDELGEVLCLMSTGKMPVAPLILFDSAFWAGFLNWLGTTVAPRGLLDDKALDLLRVADRPEEVVLLLSESLQECAA